MTHGDIKRADAANGVLLGVKRTLRFLVIATIVLYLAIGGVALFSYSTSKLNRDAVCNLTADLKDRINRSRIYVREHPEKLSQLGFTRAQVAHEIQNQERTLAALSVVPCN